jgi:transposase
VLTLPPSVRIYLSTEPVDLRKGFEGLSAIVRGAWKMDLFGGHLFVFVGRRLDRCKILFWDRAGLVLYYKRLERGRFRIPRRSADGKTLEMEATELAMLLDGLDFRRAEKPPRWVPGVRKASASKKIDSAIGI